MDVLQLNVSLVQGTSSAPSNHHVILTKMELRALYMKALVWFVDRECVSKGSCHVVFVGGVSGPAPSCPAMPLNEIRELAAQLPSDFLDENHTLEFDAFMFHAGAFYNRPYKSLLCILLSPVFLSLGMLALFVGSYLLPILADACAGQYY
ncbi:hypothetical protein C8Q80DRAFT_1275526 [Daedaleopsis nitida]|nr:hypothetical protein C8Q80DRAFT_1275526 [Daedaleopsis nitida]